MKIKRTIKLLYKNIIQTLESLRQTIVKIWYSISGKKAWSLGYLSYRWSFIHRLLDQPSFIQKFETSESFIPYGIGLDERVIEYPWIFANLASSPGLLLDAGSALNFLPLIKRLQHKNRNITIFTLAPERNCFWRESVSYHYGNLKNLPFQSTLFDEIVCISTLEHIGMDNRNYGSSSESISEEDFIIAVNELNRVLKSQGTLLITVPYGVRQYVKWKDSIFMRQFDAQLLDQLIHSQSDIDFEVSFYRYDETGWQLSTQADCADAHYFNAHEDKNAPDHAAAARAIACLKGKKR